MLAHRLSPRRQVGDMSVCKRCGAPTLSDPRDFPSCLMCGWYGYTRPPTDEDQARKVVHLPSPGPDRSQRYKSSRLGESSL